MDIKIPINCRRSYEMKTKKIICVLILIVVSILFVFTLFDFFRSLFVSNFEIVVNNKNRAEINEMIDISAMIQIKLIELDLRLN